MFYLVKCGILVVGANVTRRAFQTRHLTYFPLIPSRLNDKASPRLCLLLSLTRFKELSLVGVPGTAAGILDFRKRSLSISNRRFSRDMANKKNKNIPDRWMDYKALGKRIPGTRLIAFKVPLKQSLQKCLPPSGAFCPSDLVRLLEEQEEELGLIIDLTFTTRYYKPTDLPDSVHYLKIFTAGHAVPNDRTILSFKRAVNRFLRENENNDKLIGVHCTHGLNRTGYLVCRYLIDVEGMVPREAVTLFNRSRGYAIERQNYLKDLLSGPRRSNNGMEEPDQDPIQGGAGCGQDDPPVSRCSPFNEQVPSQGVPHHRRWTPQHHRGVEEQQQRYPRGPAHPPPPPLPPYEMGSSRPCDHEQDWRRPRHPRPPPCPELPRYPGTEYSPHGGAARNERLPPPPQDPQEAPELPWEKPHKKRHGKKKANRS
ncbi:hypothetical protein AAFF_G00389290 [Aldrovandia affinis]|uniref:RNA/RNP complex-1-interacting phosphatase n=1 Tax=Aldrovandia affinis TaxID=143900 RepID=A0AAD7SET7_9TELE|nr:hypothetical protein AAFF_G00389290 [Aldrovandia affinis]